MPSINVRFTDDEHKQLKEAAFVRGLSLQQEIIRRLFGPPPESTSPPEKPLQPPSSVRTDFKR